MKIILIMITACVIMLSCNNTEKQQTVATEESGNELVKADTTAGFQEQTVRENNKGKEEEVINRLPIKNFVIIDSTNFDNYQVQGIADDTFIKAIKFQSTNTTAEHFRLRYKVPFSENFHAIVITYRDGEHELITTLVTLDKNGHIIDQVDIAYDEVAESAFSKVGKIEKDRISIQNWNYMDEVPTREETLFSVLETGKFKPLK